MDMQWGSVWEKATTIESVHFKSLIVAFIVPQRKDMRKKKQRLDLVTELMVWGTPPKCDTKILNLLLTRCDILTNKYCKSILFQTEEVVSGEMMCYM